MPSDIKVEFTQKISLSLPPSPSPLEGEGMGGGHFHAFFAGDEPVMKDFLGNEYIL